jgi:hypothetical protein
MKINIILDVSKLIDRKRIDIAGLQVSTIAETFDVTMGEGMKSGKAIDLLKPANDDYYADLDSEIDNFSKYVFKNLCNEIHDPGWFCLMLDEKSSDIKLAIKNCITNNIHELETKDDALKFITSTVESAWHN